MDLGLPPTLTMSRANANGIPYEWRWPPLPVGFPRRGFSHPFQAPWPNRGRSEAAKEHPRTILELRMCALSHRIREIPRWWEEMRIAERWREDVLEEVENDVDGQQIWKLTPRMVDYVLEELKGYADLRDPETGIEVGPAERIWKSDKLIPSSLRERLLSAVASLENVPDPEKDWGPGSDRSVLKLVDPSLYPIVLGRTKAQGIGYARGGRPTSGKFQMLPSDFFVDPDGKVTLRSPYINNVHPTRDKGLYSVIPEALQLALPMFERVLSDTIRPLLRMRIVTSAKRGQLVEESADCIWDGDVVCPNPSGKDEYNNHPEQWFAKHSFRTPDAREHYDGDLEVMKDRISLRDRTLQVIVKLTNIVLTPESPRYSGEGWHVEGMPNETIVSNFVYYYDSENVTESRMAFRRAISKPRDHDQGDVACMRVLYNMVPRSPLVQDVGDVITKAHRCVAFPNLYQRRCQPFELQDPTKPGHMKILSLFLVDPTWRVPSASDVAPQQQSWVIDAMRGAGANSLFARLPDEILAVIAERLDEKMSRSEAEKYRDKMGAESVAFVTENNKDIFEVEYRLNGN
ncbi:hypothetical protein BJ322DRAFT_1078847 [Thelephora terrestris]|uniref:DUF4246 domain-containing protein n=1 Tax=Thelephora terrestris TaxID=56493 RepID=A0A9P6HAU9_9AGAM|nr:hypothetical protein BJ322DRAFT_1078847 [Thelephora terrestris]